MLMIKKYLEIRNDTDYFLKISGRYQILNIAKLLKFSIFDCKTDIVIDYSFFFKKCSKIIYFVKK